MYRDRHGLRLGLHRRPATGGGGDTTAPTISNVIVTPSASGATVEWNLDEGATGQIQYGTTPAYGSETTQETSFLTYHSQVISGLAGGTTYYFLIVSTDAAGNTATYEGTFDTTGSGAAPSSGVYGPAYAMDTKWNLTLNPSLRCIRMAFRFTCTHSGTPDSVMLQVAEHGVGYAGGTYGFWRIQICPDDGTGRPNESVVLAQVDSIALDSRGIGVDGSGEYLFDFDSASALTAGTVYHIVVANTDANPTVNYAAVNTAYSYGNGSAGIPHPRDQMMRSMVTTSTVPNSGWALPSGTSGFGPMFDLRYTDGIHDGQPFIRQNVYEDNDWFMVQGIEQVAELFTPPVTLSVTDINWRFANESGSTDAIVGIETAAGVLVGEATFTDSGDLASGHPTQDGYQHGWWQSAPFVHTLSAGVQYRIYLRSPDATQYSVPRGNPYTPGWSPTPDASLRYANRHPAGTPQRSIDGGSNWSNIGGYIGHFQWYLDVA